MSKLADAVKKKQSQAARSPAQEIIEGDAWRSAEPDAPATNVDGKYPNAFLMRFNDWEFGALQAMARAEDRSVQKTARRLLRQALKAAVEKGDI